MPDGTATLDDIQDSSGTASLSDIADPFQGAVESAAAATVPRPAFMRPLQPGDRNIAADQPEVPSGTALRPFSPEYLKEHQPVPLRARDVAAGALNVATGPGSTPGATPEIGTQEVKGAEHLATPGQRLRGAGEMVAATGEALSPLFGVGALEAPVSTAIGLGTGTVAGKGAKAVTKAAGGGEGAQELAENLGFWLPSLAGAVLRPKVGVAVTPEQVRVGVAAQPPGMEPIGGAVSFRRGPKPLPPGPAGIEPPTIEGNAQPTRIEVANAMDQANWDPAKAAAIVKAKPPTSPAAETPTPTVAPQPASRQAPKTAPRITKAKPNAAPTTQVQPGAVVPPVVSPSPQAAPATPVNVPRETIARNTPVSASIAQQERPEVADAQKTAVLPVRQPTAPTEPENVSGVSQAHVSEIQGKEAVETPAATVSQPSEATGHVDDIQPTYKHRSTQANIPPDSDAGKALETARARISDSDLAGDGKDIGGNHLTVRYGLKADSDIQGVRDYLASLSPFEATLGKTAKFPPSESSDGAAVIHAPVEAPELHAINAEIEKHGDFAESSFKDYRPHATVAYVQPEKAARYVGMDVTNGKKFKVDSIAITDREGKQELVKLEGKSNVEPKPQPTVPVTAEGVKPVSQAAETGGRKIVDGDRQAILQSEIKDLKEQHKAVGEKIGPVTGSYGPEKRVLVDQANGINKQIREREDELARLRGEPTRAEKRQAQKKEAEKAFAERPDKALKYDDPKHSQHWQVLEPDYIAKRFEQKAATYERAITQRQQEFDAAKPGSKTRAHALMQLKYDKEMLQSLKDKEPRLAQQFKNEYTKLVKKAVSHGSPVPEEVIAQKKEFTLAKDARERYEKGRHTSFANKSAAVNDTMQKVEGFKVKRQDGKPITDAQIQEIRDSVQDIEKVFGPMADIMRGVDLTIVHTSGTYPFLMNDAAGLYSDVDRRITLGLRGAWTNKPYPVFAHEFGHLIDIKGGNLLGSKIRVYTKGGKGYDISSLAEADRNSPLIEAAKKAINDKEEVRSLFRLMDKKTAAEMTEEEKTAAEMVKVKLGPYYYEPREVFARLFEQYVGGKLGRKGAGNMAPESYARVPGYWTQAEFDKLVPELEKEINRRLDALKERYAPAQVSAAVAAPEPAPVPVEAPKAASASPKPKREEIKPVVGATYKGKQGGDQPYTVLEVKQHDDWRGQTIVAQNLDGSKRVFSSNAIVTGNDRLIKEPDRREVISTAKTEYAAKSQIKGSDGNETKLLTPDGEQPAKYRVVEAATLTPSHNAQTFVKNPGYPEGVQERAYDTSKEAQARVIDQAQKYDPNYTINTNPDAVNGPPVVTPDGIVLGGNSRAMSTQRLYKAGNGNRYKGALITQAPTFGIDKEIVRMMKEPVLVREVAAPKTVDEMRSLGSQLNKSMTGALGVSERAVSAGKAITRESLNSIAGMIDSLGDNASLRDAMRERGGEIVNLLVKDGAITARERPQYVDTATGGLSEEGKTFVERALLGSVVDDPRLMDAAPKSVLNKLDSSLAALAALAPRTDAYNIMPLIREALREHAEIAQRGIPLEDYMGQSSLFGGGRNPAVDAIVRTLAEKSNAVKAKLRQFGQDANFDVQGQGTLALGTQPSPADAFKAAFGVDISDEELENAIIQSAQSDLGAERDRAVQSETSESSGSVQQPATGETRAGSKEAAGAARPEDKTKLGNFLTSEEGSFTPAALNPARIKKLYSDFISNIIDQKLDLGDKYRRVAGHDSTIAKMLHEKDNAPRYFRDKAESNVEQVIKGLSEDQVRLTAMMTDSDAREYLEQHHPDQFLAAQDDPAVMAGVRTFKRYQDELAGIRVKLGWHVRRDLSTVETEDGSWEVVDRDGASAGTFKSQKQAQEYVEENGKLLDHLKRTYPEHMHEPLMGTTNEPTSSGAPYGGIRPPRPDRKQRLATAEYFWEHGAKDFSGYIKSFTQAYHAALNQKIYDSLTDEATKWKEGTALPPKIEYRGKTYYSPDVAKSMKLAKPENRPKVIEEYKAYDPAKDDKALIKSFEDGWSTRTTGRPGISPSDRYLAPKDVVEALEQYDMTRGVKENDSIRRFFQDQIVGLFGPTIHVLNIMRRLATTVGTGAWDPRVWPYYQQLFFSKELRDRMAQGLADDAIDALSKNGSYTNTRDIGSLHSYFLGNMNPMNWVRQTVGKASKGILFDPKFLGGFGGLDQKARVLAYDYLKNEYDMGEEEAAKNVEDGYGNYNRANWTERMKRWARVLLFPGWDFSSLKWFLRHPIKTAIAPALVTLAANLAINAAGKNRDQDRYDFGYLHYGDRKFRTSLFTESMAAHIAEPVLSAGRAALEGGNTRDTASAAWQGIIRGGGGMAGTLRPEIQAIAELLSNRQYLGGTKEITKPEDANMPGKVLPTRQLDKLVAFTVVKALPAVGRFLDSSYENVDLATGAGSIIGVTNYKSGAEERLRANAARAKGFSQTLSELAVADPEAAKAFVQDPNKAMYLIFNKDLAELEGNLKDLDKETEEIKLVPGIPRDVRAKALASHAAARKQILNSADAIADAMLVVKLKARQ